MNIPCQVWKYKVSVSSFADSWGTHSLKWKEGTEIASSKYGRIAQNEICNSNQWKKMH